jgi:hypothetical protein
VLGTAVARFHSPALLALAALAAAVSALAQPAPAPEPELEPVPAPPASPSAPSSDIEAALSADRDAVAESSPPQAQAATTPAWRDPSRASLNPELSLIADFAAAYFSQDENLQTGGHDPTQTGFNLQQLELAASAAVDPYLRFDANLVFGLFGVELEEAYGTTLDLPLRLQARFGQFLTRFGRINSTHLHAWDFVDQPIAIGRVFGAEGNRGLGVELSWITPLPWYVEIVGSATGAAGEGTARSFFGADDLGVESPADLLYVTALEQFFPVTDDWSLLLGFSGAFGPNSTGRDNRTEVYGTDLYVKYRPITRQSSTIVTLQTEWLYRRRQVPSDVLADVSGYAQLFWRFDQRWGTAARYEYGSPSFDSSGDVAAGDPLDPEWTESRHRVSANLTYWPSEFSRFRLQGGRDMPGVVDGIWSVFLAAELVTGAHGSHAF